MLCEWCKSFLLSRKIGVMQAISGTLCESNFLRLSDSLDATSVNDVYKRVKRRLVQMRIMKV